MNTNQHMITIDSRQKMEGRKSEAISFSTVGTYKMKNGVSHIEYQDTKLTGFEGSITKLSVQGSDSVMIERTGTASSTMLVKPGERNLSFYDVGYGSLSLAVGGASIENNLDANGGTVRFCYSLDIDSSVVSENEVIISIREISNARQIPV